MSDALVTLDQLTIAETYSKAYHDSTIDGMYMPIDGGQFTGGVFGSTAQINSDGLIDLSLGSVFELSLENDITISFDNIPDGAASSFSVIVKAVNDASITWPSSVSWAGVSAPGFNAGKTYVLSIMSGDGGFSWYGFVSVSEDSAAAISALTDAEIDAAWDAVQ